MMLMLSLFQSSSKRQAVVLAQNVFGLAFVASGRMDVTVVIDAAAAATDHQHLRNDKS